MWARWSTGNCARNWNLTIRTNALSTTQNPSWRMRCKKSSGIFEMQTDYPISARRPDHIIINNKKRERELERNCRMVDFAVPAEIERKRKEDIRTLTLLENWKIYIEHESDGDANWNWCSWYCQLKELENLEIGGRVETIQTIAFFS